MKCRVCDDEEVPVTWVSVAWCDPCLRRALELREERPGLSLVEVRDVVTAERRCD